jgi:glutamyl endopeptidase
MERKLESVSSPKRSGGHAGALESAVHVRPQWRTKGNRGRRPSDLGRAADRLLRRGAGSDGALESVIGVDDRTRIFETDQYPWRMICALRIEGKAPDGSPVGYIGTGWLAGPRTVVTAGHCVYGAEMGGFATRIEVIPGLDGDARPFGSVFSDVLRTTNRWIEGSEQDFDYGAIQLSQPIGDDLGWFATASPPDEQVVNKGVRVSGYPGDKPSPWSQAAGTEQWFHTNPVVRATPRRLFYTVDTYGGQSGAPVYLAQAEGESIDPVVVGVHAYGAEATVAGLANSAPRIAPDVFQVIKGWIEEFAPAPPTERVAVRS